MIKPLPNPFWKAWQIVCHLWVISSIDFEKFGLGAWIVADLVARIYPNSISRVIILSLVGSGFFITGAFRRNSFLKARLIWTGIVFTCFCFLIGPYIKGQVFKPPVTTESNFEYSLFYDADQRVLTTGILPNSYDSSYFPMFSKLYPNDYEFKDVPEILGPKGMNIIEKGIIQALAMRFMNHWDINPSHISGPGFSITSTGDNSTEDNLRINFEQFAQLFKHNPLMTQEHMLKPLPLNLPPKSKINCIQDDASTVIESSNSEYNLRIRIYRSVAGPLQYGIPGILPRDIKNMDRYFGISFRVSADATLDANNPKIDLYKRWIDNVNDVLATFDWEHIQKKLELETNQKVYEKLLGD